MFHVISDEEDTASASMSNSTPKAQAQPVLSNGVAVSYTPSRYCLFSQIGKRLKDNEKDLGLLHNILGF